MIFFCDMNSQQETIKFKSAYLFVSPLNLSEVGEKTNLYHLNIFNIDGKINLD